MDKKNIVLFVDDEIHILNSIRRATMDEDFEAVFVGSGQEALKVFEEREISVIVTDMRMPGMDGLSLLKIIRDVYPQTIRIVLSGYTQLSQVLVTINQGDIFQFIPKPWHMEEELLTTVRRGIEYFNLQAERNKLYHGLERKNQAYLNIFRTMEQRLANEKKDLANLKRINHWVFSFWEKHLEFSIGHADQDKSSFKEYVELIEEFQSLYLNALPSVVEGKTVESIITDITRACAGDVIIKNTIKEDQKLVGYYGFLTMVFKAVVYLVKADGKVPAPCDMLLDEKSTEAPRVVFNLDLKVIAESVIEQNRIKIGCSLLNEMGNTYNIKVLQKAAEGKIVSIRVIWDASSESLPPAGDEPLIATEP